MVALALSFDGFVSVSVRVALAVLTICVWLTVIVAEMLTLFVAPGFIVAHVQFTVPLDSEHVGPPGVTLLKESPAGSASVRMTFDAREGPLFATVIAYVTDSPSANAPSGPGSLAALVTATSTRRMTSVVVDVLLFAVIGSGLVVDVDTGWMIVDPLASDGSVVTTKVKLPEPVLGESGSVFVQVTAPVPPTLGVEQLHPAGGVMETNVVPGGVVWVRTTPYAGTIVELLVTLWVNVSWLPAITGSGESLLATERSTQPDLMPVIWSKLAVRITLPGAPGCAP